MNPLSPTQNPIADLPAFLQTSLGQEYARLTSPNDETIRLLQIRALTEKALDPIRRRSARPDITQMPSNGTRVQLIGTTPYPGTSKNSIVIFSYRVPVGHTGYINFIMHGYTGQGFGEGSGDLTWAILFGNATAAVGSSANGLASYPYYQYGAMKTSLGSLTNQQWAVGGGLPITENQYITYAVSVSSTSQVTPGGQIYAGVLGWIAPK